MLTLNMIKKGDLIIWNNKDYVVDECVERFTENTILVIYDQFTFEVGMILKEISAVFEYDGSINNIKLKWPTNDRISKFNVTYETYKCLHQFIKEALFDYHFPIHSKNITYDNGAASDKIYMIFENGMPKFGNIFDLEKCLEGYNTISDMCNNIGYTITDNKIIINSNNTIFDINKQIGIDHNHLNSIIFSLVVYINYKKDQNLVNLILDTNINDLLKNDILTINDFVKFIIRYALLCDTPQNIVIDVCDDYDYAIRFYSSLLKIGCNINSSNHKILDIKNITRKSKVMLNDSYNILHNTHIYSILTNFIAEILMSITEHITFSVKNTIDCKMFDIYGSYGAIIGTAGCREISTEVFVGDVRGI